MFHLIPFPMYSPLYAAALHLRLQSRLTIVARVDTTQRRTAFCPLKRERSNPEQWRLLQRSSARCTVTTRRTVRGRLFIHLSVQS